MASRSRKDRYGKGGLYIIRREAWNEFKQAYEMVDFYQASREIQDPQNPDKRKRVTGTGRSLQEAQARLHKSLVRFYKKRGLAEAGVVLKGRSKGSKTLAEYFEEWYSELRPERISVTLQLKYKQHFHNHILPHIGKMSLTELSYQDLHNLIYVTLPKKKKKKNGVEIDERLLGPNAILNIYRTLNLALGIAVKKGKIDRNPLSLVDTPRYVPPKENVPQMVHIVEHMFKRMNEENDPMFDHFLLALLGLRRAERLGLTFSSLNLTGNNPKLTIQNQLTRVTGKGLFIKPATKSGKDRTVALQDPWLSSLRRMREKRKQQLKLESFNPDKKFADLVFLKDDGKPYDLNEDNEMWKKANQIYNAKRKPIRGHALRHVGATKMADSGVERDVAMAILGHESHSISFYYGRMNAHAQAKQLGKYGESLTEKIKPK